MRPVLIATRGGWSTRTRPRLTPRSRPENAPPSFAVTRRAGAPIRDVFLPQGAKAAWRAGGRERLLGRRPGR